MLPKIQLKVNYNKTLKRNIFPSLIYFFVFKHIQKMIHTFRHIIHIHSSFFGSCRDVIIIMKSSMKNVFSL